MFTPSTVESLAIAPSLILGRLLAAMGLGEAHEIYVDNRIEAHGTTIPNGHRFAWLVWDIVDTAGMDTVGLLLAVVNPTPLLAPCQNGLFQPWCPVANPRDEAQ